jgi:RimJ/RimL family protein N-acetyltransferase
MSSPAVIRPTAESDLDFVLTAERSPENAPFIRQWSRDRHLQACNHPNERHWIVTDSATKNRAGYVILLGVQDPDQCLLIKRIVITQKGRGIGRLTLGKILDIAFLELEAHRVWLDVMEDNQRARSLYRSVGFVEEGRLRECVKTDRGFLSMWLMSMLRSEFLAKSGQH